MKIKKSLLKAMSVGITLSLTASACEKEVIKPSKDETQCVKKNKKEQPPFDCPACGMG